MKLKRLLILGLALVLPSLVQAATSYGVVGSPHDFSQETWQSRNGVCSPCHAAHHTDEAQLAPLWNHATAGGPFVPYNNLNQSPSLDATVGNPTGASLACLSCHDGTVAINQLHSGTVLGGTAVYIDSGAQIGPDLHTTHPISFTYDSALASLDGGLADPAVYTIGSEHWPGQAAPVPTSWPALGTSLVGKTIQDALMSGGTTMHCSTCHDVHKMEGSAPSSGILAKISGADVDGAGSTLCRTCHLK